MVSATTRPEDRSEDPIDAALARSESTFRSPRMFDAADTDAVEGEVHWKPAKSLWISAMTLTALIGGPVFFTWGALALFLVTYCLVASFTEVGFTGPSPYMLELALAASLLIPPATARNLY